MLESVVLERYTTRSRHELTSGTQHKRQRIYILPTRQGISFSVLLLTMLLGAVNYNNSMAYLLTFLLSSLFLVAILHTYRNLAGLIITSHPAEPVFAGETARFPFSIDNRNGHAHLALELCCYPKQPFLYRHKRDAYPVSRTNVAALHIDRSAVMLPSRERGRLAIHRIRISTCFPLGLCRAWAYIESDQFCVVYPTPAGTSVLPSGRPGSQQNREGNKSGTNDFVGFHHYRPGDSVRSIAWKKLAHDDQLLVKRFSGDGGDQLMFNWDDTGTFGLTEARLSQLCIWILRAEQLGFQYGLLMPGISLEPDNGANHQRQCLEALALFGAD